MKTVLVAIAASFVALTAQASPYWETVRPDSNTIIQSDGSLSYRTGNVINHEDGSTSIINGNRIYHQPRVGAGGGYSEYRNGTTYHDNGSTSNSIGEGAYSTDNGLCITLGDHAIC